MIPPDLQIQIQRLLDGELSAEEAAELDADLLGSDDCLEVYRKMASLHSDLETLHASPATLGKSNIVPIDRIIVRQRQRIVKLALGAVAAVAILSLLVLSLVRAPENPLASFRTTPDSDFTLTHSESREDALEGQVLDTGSILNLRTGSLEGNFRSGVRFVVEAPCVLTVAEEGRVILDRGTAWFEVPPQATGFSVETERLSIIDLGTEFGVDVSEAIRDEVHVIRGLVEVTSHAKGGEALTLRAGEAVRMEDEGGLEAIEVDADQFAKELPAVEGLIGHWKFETQATGITPDSSGNGHSGRLMGSARIGTDRDRGNVLFLPGTGSGNGMVDIDSIKPIPNLPKRRGFTLAAWVKHDESATGGGLYAYAVALGEEGNHPIATLGVTDGFVNGFIEGNGSDHQVQVTSDAQVSDGEWTHIAISCDRASHVATIYINGVQQGSPSDISAVGGGELDWGFAKIGRTLSDRHVQYFVGMIDDVRIYDRPLGGAEIGKLAR